MLLEFGGETVCAQSQNRFDFFKFEPEVVLIISRLADLRKGPRAMAPFRNVKMTL